MSPDFHRHGLFHPRRSAVLQLPKAPSVVGRIRKEAMQPAHRIRTGRPSAPPKPHHCCGMFYYFFAALFSRHCRLFFRYPYLSKGEGQDGIGWGRMGTGWGCGISLYLNAKRAPCFSATPTIGIQNAAAAANQPSQPRSAQLLLPRSPTQRQAVSGCHLCTTHTASSALQVILHK